MDTSRSGEQRNFICSAHANKLIPLDAPWMHPGCTLDALVSAQVCYALQKMRCSYKVQSRYQVDS